MKHLSSWPISLFLLLAVYNAPILSAVLITTPAIGATVETETTSVSGTATVGTKVQVFVDGSFLATATVSAGAWSVSSTKALANGNHAISAFEVDATGVVQATAINEFVVATIGPANAFRNALREKYNCS